MTKEEVIKMLQTEKACVERQERKQNCNRYCESCDLCMPIEDVIEGYNCAIRALKNEPTGQNVGMCQKNVGEMSEKQTDGVVIELEKIKENINEIKGDNKYVVSDYMYGRYQAFDIVDDIITDRIAELKGEQE